MTLLELRGISKRYGKLEALTGVDFSLEAGEIHVLLGENGAGKSTLMKIAYGLLTPDAGTITVHGTTRRFASPRQARDLGIGLVHQHFTSIPAFTVAENVALAAGWSPRLNRVRPRVRTLAERSGLTIDPDLTVAALSAGLKQRLEILQALAGDVRILLLDEPTAVLSPPEAESLLRLVRGFRESGVGTVLITHKLGEAMAVADRVTVLRRGQVMLTGKASEQSEANLVDAMLGPGNAAVATPVAPPMGPEEAPPRVRANGLRVPRLGQSGTGLREASFSLRAGEILGIAAVEGNGQRELLRAIAGLVPGAAGSLRVDSPVSFIPEDRSTEGLIRDFSLTENLVLSQGRAAPWVRRAVVDWPGARKRTAELIDQFGVRALTPDVPAGSLSGGNQQRVLIAQALERRPAVLVAENPTRGLDVRATAEVHHRLREASRQGVAVVVYLADLDELLLLAHRVAVLAGGVLGELPAGASRDDIGRRMVGVNSSDK